LKPLQLPKSLIRAGLAAGILLSAGLAHAACGGVTIAGICFKVTTIPLPEYNGLIAGASDADTAVGIISNSNAFIHPGFGFILPSGGTVEMFSDPAAISPVTLTQASAIQY
jgi:hypothetical protein